MRKRRSGRAYRVDEDAERGGSVLAPVESGVSLVQWRGNERSENE